MAALLRESLDAGAIGLSSGVFYATGAAADVDELALLASHRRRGGRRLHDAHPQRDERHLRGARRGVRHGAARQRAGRDLASQVRGAAELGPHRGDARAHRRGARAPTRSASTPTRTSPARRSCAPTWSTASSTSSSRGRRRIRRWRRGISRTSPRSGAARSRKRASGCSPAAHATSRCARTTCSACCAIPATMIGSDGLPHDRHPHPRLWGTFPRVLGHYSRDLALFPLEIAVHKMTGLSARRFNLRERGELRDGWFADVCLFDPATVADVATFERTAGDIPRHRPRDRQWRHRALQRANGAETRRTIPVVPTRLSLRGTKSRRRGRTKPKSAEPRCPIPPRRRSTCP